MKTKLYNFALIMVIITVNAYSAVPPVGNFILGGNFNYDKSQLNINEVDQPLELTEGDVGFNYNSEGVEFVNVDGRWGGGLKTKLTGYNYQRARWQPPSSWNAQTGMAGVWIKCSSGSKDIDIFDFGNGSESNILRWQASDKRLKLVVNGVLVTSTNDVFMPTDLCDGQWHHVAFSWDQDGTQHKGKRIWFDGYTVGWNDGHFTSMPVPQYIGLGSANYGGAADVYWDELHILTEIPTVYKTWAHFLTNYLSGSEIELPDILPENCGQVGTQYLAGDANRDCYVDINDLTSIAEKWLASTEF